MNKIKLNPKYITKIVDDLTTNIVNNHISNITVVNSLTIVMQFSFYRKKRLLISLEKNEPYIALLENIDSIPTIDSGLSSQLRHHVKDGYIVDVNQVNNDSIICIHFKMKTSENEVTDKYLIIELIPLKANLLVLREDYSVVFATHYGNENEKRNLTINQIYQLPELETLNTEFKDISINEIYKYGYRIYEKALLKRKKEKFDPSFKYIKNKIKLLKRKIPVLEQEILVGEDGLCYQELGNSCFYMEEKDLKTIFKDSNKKYDDELSNIENANLCFKLYKKSKNKIAEANHQLEIAKQDLQYFEHLLRQWEIGSEEDVGQIQMMLIPNKKMKPQERRTLKSHAPYFVKLDKETIYFGKNDVQNDHLTFKVAHYKDIFVHIANYPGAHIVIKTDKLSDEALLTACEFALLLSNKPDGDISYTEVKNVKKTEKLGLVKIKECKNIHLKTIRSKTKELLKTATKRS